MFYWGFHTSFNKSGLVFFFSIALILDSSISSDSNFCSALGPQSATRVKYKTQLNATKRIALKKLPTTPASVSPGLLKKEKEKKYFKQADFVVWGNEDEISLLILDT